MKIRIERLPEGRAILTKDIFWPFVGNDNQTIVPVHLHCICNCINNVMRFFNEYLIMKWFLERWNGIYIKLMSESLNWTHLFKRWIYSVTTHHCFALRRRKVHLEIFVDKIKQKRTKLTFALFKMQLKMLTCLLNCFKKSKDWTRLFFFFTFKCNIRKTKGKNAPVNLES